MENLKKYIDEIKDFPREGIVFKDLNPIYKVNLVDGSGLSHR